MVIVTELLLGGTLRKYLLNMRPRCLDMRVAIGFALDIACGMECLHSHGIIHRDLKPVASDIIGEKHGFASNGNQIESLPDVGFTRPVKDSITKENLLLTADNRTVKLADFGLAREEHTAETGTYRWMAPELYSTVTLRQGEKKHYNHKVDAYSFAIVLWELLHNKLPFEGMSNLQAAYSAAFKNVRPSAENLPEELAIILTSSWKEDPNARPNFSEIIQMLLNFISGMCPPEPTAIPPRIFASENSILAPESPGTSSLMGVRDDSEETPKARKDKKQRSFFFCFDHVGIKRSQRGLACLTSKLFDNIERYIF
ncbi:Serine/threonine-protein kinase HT1 [Gossypium arboreum]|uniref:Serine/threonine-protein kinase HT1 n=1 Tax=Gossypium arboreum TaxID=29729 RepID=A0A0B0NAB7_GOSAR|nr:Serine/threonine-protein kinase HT1 [Gossypium arboreum]